MARTLSVKVPTARLIADVEASIAKIDEAIANYANDRKQYEADVKQYNADVLAKAIEVISNPDNIGTDRNQLVQVSTNYRGGVTIELDTEALGFPVRPTEPQRPNEKQYFGRDYTTRKDILEKNLRILRMTSQEEVSASSYSSVMDLL